MKNPLRSDPEILSVPWRDLVELRPTEIFRELTLVVPWLIAGLWLTHVGWVAAALPAFFMLFLAGLRSAHDAQHYNLGISRRQTDLFMLALSVVMLGSVHAVQVNHLRHHRHCLTEADFEARSAHMAWWQAIFYGPRFFVLIHVKGLRNGSRKQRRWIVSEMSLVSLTVALAFATEVPSTLQTYAGAMLCGQCLTAFFAVWTVHHDVDPEQTIARTQRGFWNSAFYGMFFHVEHHLFPRVPTPHLTQLAARLDRVRPDLCKSTVLP